MSKANWLTISGLASVICVTTPSVAWSQRHSTANAEGPYLTVGLFIASIEEGARIFTPVRLLPFEHPEALGHEFPTVLRFHDGEDDILVTLGRQAGLLLGTTLQRYPRQPDDAWPYDRYQRPPATSFNSVVAQRRSSDIVPLPGLRAVAFIDRFPLAFIVDTRGMSLAERRMQRATSSGLDVTREQLLQALRVAAAEGPSAGPWILVYERP